MTVELLKPSEAFAIQESFDSSQFFEFDNSAETVKKYIYHSLNIGSLHLLVPEGTLGEVLNQMPVCPLPQTSRYLAGMCSLRGSIVPVFDLHYFLGISSATECDKIVVVGTGINKVGFFIDALPAKVTFTEDDYVTRKPPLPSKLVPFVKNCFHRDGFWIEWDIFGLFRETGKQV